MKDKKKDVHLDEATMAIARANWEHLKALGDTNTAIESMISGEIRRSGIGPQISEEDEAVLVSLLNAHPRLLGSGAICGTTGLGDKTVASSLKFLGRICKPPLVHWPRGPKSGAGLTLGGHELMWRKNYRKDTE